MAARRGRISAPDTGGETELVIPFHEALPPPIPADPCPAPPNNEPAPVSLTLNGLGMQLYDAHGRRKYLTPSERQQFITSSADCPRKVSTFCATLAHTGCRISEALALTVDRVDIDDGVLIFESLKKRRRGVFRAVPVSAEFMIALDDVHKVRAMRSQPDGGRGVHLWPWSRPTGWRYVCAVMKAAGIEGLHATPKGLRHGFGIKAVVSNVPLNMTQKWLGHAQLSTTAIYTDATGPEEKQIAERMWT